MRGIWLIRHGHPDFPLDAHVCLGRTDTPLGALGRMQAAQLGEALRGTTFGGIFSSPLTRCCETAAPLGGEARLVAALAEQDMGPWDGLDFNEIRERWPELYARRGSEPLLVPPEAETLEAVQTRAVPALLACLEESGGDIAVVAHASVIQALRAAARGIALEASRPLRPPYAGCVTLCFDGTRLIETEGGMPPTPPLTPAFAERLLEAAAPGERVTAHSRTVMAEALRIARALPLALDEALLASAALLHDIARAEPEHARLGAAWLRELGYFEAAELVVQHHDLRSLEIDEAAILYIADKCVREDRRVTIEERFAASGKRCTDEAARAAHARRLETARALRDEINRLCGRQVVA